jgi:uncharacterized protein YndB with AHSA1/START domain
MSTGTQSSTSFVVHDDPPSIVMSRVFNAPRELVFRACTEPEHFARWWGPRRYTNTVLEMDVRPGGTWRVVQRSPEGHEHPFRGVFREVEPPSRLVQTQVYDVEPYSQHELTVVITFEDQDGRTLLTSTTLFSSREDRDATLQMGMKDGAVESLDRLAELLKTLA